MIQAHRLTADNIDRIADIYAEFSARACVDFQWDVEPVPFEAFKSAIRHGILKGYWVEDTGKDAPIAFMLYRLEDHRAIEINVIYAKPEAEKKTVIDRLMRKFIADERDTEGWDVVSYAMLGEPQEAFIRTLSWYGFKPVGQAIVKFDITDMLTLQIMKQQQCPLPDGYTIETWKPEYAEGVAQSALEAFEKAADACWDPRFRTIAGTRKVVGLLTGHLMGGFLPQCTSVLLRDGTPVGFCFLLQTGMTQGNIPLIGVRPAEKKKGLGNALLKNTLESCLSAMLAGEIAMLEITATLDTDNIPAIKMYRRLGFREHYNYPHTYLPREAMQRQVVGKWC